MFVSRERKNTLTSVGYALNLSKKTLLVKRVGRGKRRQLLESEREGVSTQCTWARVVSACRASRAREQMNVRKQGNVKRQTHK